MGVLSKTVKPLLRRIQNFSDIPAIVLLYHRVANLANDKQELAVSQENFAQQVYYLKNNYNLLEIESFAEHLKNKVAFPEKSVIITFDDGYADNYYNALPVLEKYNAQGLFYITTSKLNSNSIFWWDALEYAIFKSSNTTKKLTLKIQNREYTFPAGMPSQKVYNALHPLIKYTHYKERDSLIERVVVWADDGELYDDRYRILSHSELTKMSESRSAIIGAHTTDHPVLSLLSKEEQFEQIIQSKAILESLVKKDVVHFSYPYGTKSDYNRDSVKICNSVGFQMAASNYPWQVHSFTNRFEIPRFLVRNWDIGTFKQKIDSFFKH